MNETKNMKYPRIQLSILSRKIYNYSWDNFGKYGYNR